jgi:membrane protease YdiL (CAAX protease family)
MKTCGYCGRANPVIAQLCDGCGMELAKNEDVQPNPVIQPSPPKIAVPRVLDAWNSTLILFGYLGASVFSALFGAIVAILLSQGRGTSDANVRIRMYEGMTPIIEVVEPFLGFAVVVLAGIRLVPNQLKNTSPYGAAWIVGSGRGITQGLITGAVFSVIIGLIIKYTHPDISYNEFGALGRIRMAMTPGVPRIILAISTVVLRAPEEELFFRGVLYGGFRKSFGAAPAAICMTLVFVLFHIPAVFQSMTAFVAISSMALITLWFRLRFQAIGPAIAAHVGYNAVIMAAIFW